MATHAMIDIETLDTRPNSVVLSVGAVKFDPYAEIEPHTKTLWRPGVDDQLAQGRTMSNTTLEWWAKQDQAIQDVAFTDEGRVPVDAYDRDARKRSVIDPFSQHVCPVMAPPA